MIKLTLGAATRAVCAAVLIAGGLTAAMPATAQASPQDCERGARGFVDIPDNQSGVEVGPGYHFDLHPGASWPGRITLKHARINGEIRGFASLTGPWAGDEVWMDWTVDGGRNWVQCGPFRATRLGDPLTTAAQRTDNSTNWRFRACGSRGNGSPVQCTGWW
ncbi:hypothetical protein [Streptomyces sp. NPDC002994]|uniref:hypothetical protein n=1 Tax=Streptomyces sp. NPDC002994 TaxID=3154441 RepID=UPI0033A8D418